MLAKAHSFDAFTQDEIADAYEICITHQEEFLSNTPGGVYLRNEAFKHFKQMHPECTTIESLAIQADLENDHDIKNVCVMKLDAIKYAEDHISNDAQ